MPGPRIRPTFSIPLAQNPEDSMTVLRDRLEGSQWSECVRSKGRCAEFFVREEDRRLWSPYLSVQLEPKEKGSLLRGRFGPHPEIWTLFMFLYTAVGFLSLMGLILGFVQWQSGMEAWGFWGAYLGIPGLLILYGVSATGQRLSAHQMDELQDRVYTLVHGLEAS